MSDFNIAMAISVVLLAIAAILIVIHQIVMRKRSGKNETKKRENSLPAIDDFTCGRYYLSVIFYDSEFV